MNISATIEIIGVYEVYDLTDIVSPTSGGIKRSRVAATNAGFFLIDERDYCQKGAVYKNSRLAFEHVDFLFAEKVSIQDAIRVGNEMLGERISCLREGIRALESKDLKVLWENSQSKTK